MYFERAQKGMYPNYIELEKVLKVFIGKLYMHLVGTARPYPPRCSYNGKVLLKVKF